MTLRKHSTTSSPTLFFETAGVLDLSKARKAGLDLDRMIELSESITKAWIN